MVRFCFRFAFLELRRSSLASCIFIGRAALAFVAAAIAPVLDQDVPLRGEDVPPLLGLHLSSLFGIFHFFWLLRFNIAFFFESEPIFHAAVFL